MAKLPISPEQCRGARGLLGPSQLDLGKAANVSVQMIANFERGVRTPYANKLTAIKTALESAGVEFIDQNGGGPGVRLEKQ